MSTNVPIDHTDAPTPIMVSPDRADPVATEWLLTNSIGGYAMGTVLGVPTRRYHALLVAALKPPVDRVVALHSMDEAVIIDRGSAVERTVNLTRFHFGSSPDRPRTHPALATFTKGSHATWVYRLDGVRIEKRLHLVQGRNAVEIRYAVRAPGRRVRLCLRPLVALRGFHDLRRRPANAPPEQVFQSRTIGMGVVIVADSRGVVITSDAPSFRADPAWWTGLHYERDADRGQDHVEDLYTPGEFLLDSHGLDDHAVATIYATCDAKPADQPDAELAPRTTRLRAMTAACIAQLSTPPDVPTRAAIETLCAAGDDFVVPRGGSASDPYGKPGRTILAGFPWFVDWGRDAMLCVPGLLIATGRLDDAYAVLSTFARHRRDGLIPNRFDDFGGTPHYNTADASLWFIHAVGELAKALDRQRSSPPNTSPPSIDPELLAACTDIIAAYQAGTSTGSEADPSHPHRTGDLSDVPPGRIAADPADGLIIAGDHHTQLTWMDARRDGISFTPRAGKAVEINALWHHALVVTSRLLATSNPARAAELTAEAQRVAASFRLLFWNGARACLYDLVPDPSRPLIGQPAAQVRPNQVIAAALEHSPLTNPQRAAVVECARRHLLTPFGLRTLEPADPHYRSRYAGTLRQRDEAYHNGTVWPWLQGVYVEAFLRAEAFSPASCAKARALLQPLLDQMQQHCLGQIAEIYDAESASNTAAPQASPRPDGCPAQAWSIALNLRAMLLSLGAEA